MYFAGDSMKNVCCLIQHHSSKLVFISAEKERRFYKHGCISIFPPNILFTYLSPLMRVHVALLTFLLVCRSYCLFLLVVKNLTFLSLFM